MYALLGGKPNAVNLDNSLELAKKLRYSTPRLHDEQK